MGYSITFIRRQDLSIDNIYDVLETSDPKLGDEAFISKSEMESVVKQLKLEGLNFEVFTRDDKDYVELNFPTYQVSMFNSEIALSVPYWDENGEDSVNIQISKIINVLLQNGFTGFDSQTEEFITEEIEIQSNFIETKSVTEEILINEVKNEKNSPLVYVGIGLGLTLIGFLIWKWLAK